MYNGILIVNKPAGISSHGVVARLRRILGEKKIGHGGTLDPMAEGVLPVFIGRATRASGLLQEGGKAYLAHVRLGITTDTQDTTGAVLSKSDRLPARAQIEEALSAFRGEIEQIPPMYSALSVGGVRLYKLARNGEEIERAAKIANADFFIRHLPKGYDTMLTADGANLSQGQRQLLAIARAAVADPPVLILDEATSSIDTRTEALIEKGMDSLMQGRTVFVIAHRLSTVRNSNAIMVLEKGNIIERGDHNSLLEQKGRYYKLYMGMFELS